MRHCSSSSGSARARRDTRPAAWGWPPGPPGAPARGALSGATSRSTWRPRPSCVPPRSPVPGTTGKPPSPPFSHATSPARWKGEHGGEQVDVDDLAIVDGETGLSLRSRHCADKRNRTSSSFESIYRSSPVCGRREAWYAHITLAMAAAVAATRRPRRRGRRRRCRQAPGAPWPRRCLDHAGQRIGPDTQRHQHIRWGVRGPSPDRGKRGRPGQHRAHRDRQHRGQTMPAPTTIPWIRHRRQIPQQPRRLSRCDAFARYPIRGARRATGEDRRAGTAFHHGHWIRHPNDHGSRACLLVVTLQRVLRKPYPTGQFTILPRPCRRPGQPPSSWTATTSTRSSSTATRSPPAAWVRRRA